MTAWAALLAAAAPAAQSLSAAIGDPRGAQLRLLRDMIDANADSAFGRAHGFAGIANLDDYRSAVPASGYEAFEPWIARIADGEPAVLTQAPVVAFEETGGTASGRKLIPYTARSLTAFRAAVLPWLADLAVRRPAVTEGRVYAAISPATRAPGRAAGGLPIGLGSDAAYLGDDLAGAFLSLLVTSPGVAAIEDVETWRVETLAQMVSAPDLAFVSVWSPTFLLDLVAALLPLADAVARRCGEEGRARLGEALGGAGLDTTRLWPRLACISCWTEGASAPFAAELQALFPYAAVEPKGLLATEGPITLPFGSGPGAIPALNASFVEYVDEEGRAHLCNTLEPGHSYRLLITTWGGLYRYDIGDMVRCVAMDGALPRLVFEGRGDATSDLVGEKLDDAFVARALAGLGTPSLLVPRTRPHCHYELWLQQADDPDAAAGRADAALRANPQYAHARRIGQLGPVRAVEKPGFMTKIHDEAVAAGRRLGDTKAVALLTGGGG